MLYCRSPATRRVHVPYGFRGASSPAPVGIAAVIAIAMLVRVQVKYGVVSTLSRSIFRHLQIWYPRGGTVLTPPVNPRSSDLVALSSRLTSVVLRGQ
ncbi:hypothetical protein AcV7_005678 [Taiwanofungus camphoratus]|nr:hypothetical protein AcV7_005678 [Antrodia cinnamomea]